MQKKYHSAEYLRSSPHLRLRTPFNALLARMRSESDYCFASFFRDRHFVRAQPPIITSSDCEGAGEVFSISSNSSPSPEYRQDEASGRKMDEFFREPKFLTVSSQMHLEAFVHEHPKVWTLSPTFRAERSDTPRHISEFWMLEVEMRTENLDEVMDLVQEMIRFLTVTLQSLGIKQELESAYRGSEKSLSKDTAQFVDLLHERWQGLAKVSWPRVTYQSAMQLLQDAVEAGKAAFHYKPSWATGLQLEHERYLVATIGSGSPVFVTHYPQKLKPFYMLPSSLETANDVAENTTVACFDLLLPQVCEVVGGSLREHRLQNLTESMRNKNVNVSRSSSDSAGMSEGDGSANKKGDLDWYVDLRRYGSVPHGGFGLGYDRLLSYLAGINNIKDTVPWPRYYGRCDC